MTTQSKNKNPVDACDTDNNQRKLYEVTVYRTEYQWCRVRVQSTSEEEAKQIGSDLASEKGEWETEDAEEYVHSVAQVREGRKDNE